MRKRDGQKFYRRAKTTLASRVKKKLTEKTSRYKIFENTQQEKHDTRPERGGVWRRGEVPAAKHPMAVIEEERKNKQNEKSNVKAVIFVPQTENSGLAKMLRENEEEMCRITGYKMKIVERAGRSLTSLLVKSNPWGGEDCGREGLLLCHTKADKGKNLDQN